MLATFQSAPEALDVVCRSGDGRRESRLAARGGVGKRDTLVHDAGELAAALTELLLGLAREPRAGTRTVHSEDATHRISPKPLADLVRLVERLERLGTAQKSNGPGAVVARKKGPLAMTYRIGPSTHDVELGTGARPLRTLPRSRG
jgi:hypothetical protein